MRKFVRIFDFSMSLSLLSLVMLLVFAANAKASVNTALNASANANNARINRYVVAVSANYGGEGRPTLRYAESDAKSFAQVLKDMGGVNPQNVLQVKEPSVASLQKELDKLDKKIAENKSSSGRDEVLVYYSGHADDKGLRLGSEVYAWKALRSRIDALHADVKIAVIDACGSGAITRAKGGVAVPAFMMDASSDMKGYAFITSSTQDESSQESDKLQGSFFTHSLVSGLRGAGDLSGDGKVTLSEAYQFAFNETLQKTQSTMGGAQHPSRDMNLAGTGDVVMTDLRSINAGLVFEKSLEGRIFVRDGRGELVAELYKKSGREMELGLPSGKYAVLLERPAMNLAYDVNVANGKRENVSAAQFHEINRETTVSRGEIRADSVNVRFDSLDHNGKFRTTFNLVDRDTAPRKGMMLGLFVTRTEDIMLGSQLALIGNVAKEEIHGLQVAPVFNISRKKIEGFQLSSAVNISRSFNGLQVAPFNVTKNASKGLQIGSVNAAADTVSLAQVGAVNVVGFSKIQAGSVNIAKNSHVQVGAVNIALNNDDTQVGAVNVTAKSSGRQWGIINIVGHADKTPIGLFNFVGNGVWSATGSINELGAAAMSVHFGTAYMFTALEFSREFEKGSNFRHFDDVYENGFGIGTQFGKYGSHFELEYMFLNVNDKYKAGVDFTIRDKDDKDDKDDKEFEGVECESGFHHRLRLGYVAQVVKGVGLTVGGTMNLATEGYAGEILVEPLGEWHDNFNKNGNHKARIWPGFYAGLTLGRF